MERGWDGAEGSACSIHRTADTVVTRDSGKRMRGLQMHVPSPSASRRPARWIAMRRVRGTGCGAFFPGDPDRPRSIHRMRFLAVLLVLLLRMPVTAAAQDVPAVVTGQVMILDSARAGAAVLVRIESANVGAVADSTGHYRLVIPPSRFADGDSVVIGATRIGLRPHSRRIRLVAGGAVRADFGMKRWISPYTHPCYEAVYGMRAGEEPRTAVEHHKLCSLAIPTRKLGGSPAPP